MRDNQRDLVQFYYAYNEAFIAADSVQLKKFFHPSFRGREGDMHYGIEHILERSSHAKARYGVYFFQLIGCQALSANTALFLTYFYGHDKILDKPSERHFSVYLEFEGNQIIREAILSNPPFDDDFSSPKENLTIEAIQKKRLDQILKLSNHNDLSLTLREMDCLYFYLVGKTYREIGEQLSISRKTVESHLNNVKLKCGLSSAKEIKTLFKIN